MKLDRNRPYAQVYPPHNGVAFEQDNKQFDVAGNLIKGARGAAKTDEAAPEAAPVVNEQLAAQLEG